MSGRAVHWILEIVHRTIFRNPWKPDKLQPTRLGVWSGPGRCGHLGSDRTDGHGKREKRVKERNHKWGSGEIFGDDKTSVSKFGFLPLIFGGGILLIGR